jgi:acyl-CoA hydrolase
MSPFKIIIAQPARPMPHGRPDMLVTHEYIVMAETLEDALTHVELKHYACFKAFGAQIINPVLSTPESRPRDDRFRSEFIADLVAQATTGTQYKLIAQSDEPFELPVSGDCNLDVIYCSRVHKEIFHVDYWVWNKRRLNMFLYRATRMQFGVVASPDSGKPIAIDRPNGRSVIYQAPAVGVTAPDTVSLVIDIADTVSSNAHCEAWRLVEDLQESVFKGLVTDVIRLESEEGFLQAVIIKTSIKYSDYMKQGG